MITVTESTVAHWEIEGKVCNRYKFEQTLP